jgi:hypothetical protein
MMPMTMVASVKTAPIAPKTMGIVSVSKVLDAEAAEVEFALALAVWVTLGLGPRLARSMLVSEVKRETKAVVAMRIYDGSKIVLSIFNLKVGERAYV